METETRFAFGRNASEKLSDALALLDDPETAAQALRQDILDNTSEAQDGSRYLTVDKGKVLGVLRQGLGSPTRSNEDQATRRGPQRGPVESLKPNPQNRLIT